MVDIDLKDRKILYELDVNCRQSNARIGKTVGLSREMVNYRIKRMQDKGIITCFWTAVNTYRLGYEVIRIYISFQDVGSAIKDEIIQYFVDCENTWAVISFKGGIDLDVLLWVKDFNGFYQFWNKTLERFGNYFEHQTVSTLNTVIAYKKSFLLPDCTSNKEYYRISSGGETSKIDKVDFQLLNEIVMNARIPLIELSKRLGFSSQAVTYRINNLMKKEIIKAFRVEINLSKVGLEKFGISIYLKNHSKKRSLTEYLKDKIYLDYIDEAIGWADIQFEVIVKNMDKLFEIIDEIETKFPGVIRKQTFVMTQKYHKERWLPEMSF